MASREIEGLSDRYARLTKREAQVFERVVAGKLNKQIADDLGTTERTIKWHRAQVMEKMGASSLAELVHISEQLIAADITSRRSLGEA
jgi:FixJ family two-component response regulator